MVLFLGGLLSGSSCKKGRRYWSWRKDDVVKFETRRDANNHLVFARKVVVVFFPMSKDRRRGVAFFDIAGVHETESFSARECTCFFGEEFFVREIQELPNMSTLSLSSNTQKAETFKCFFANFSSVVLSRIYTVCFSLSRSTSSET